MDRLGNIIKFCKSERVRPPKYSEKVYAGFCRAIKKHAIMHPDRFIARNKARRALKAMPCEVCGTMEQIERHHHNYAKPLEITFLCKTHHHELHSWDSN